MNTFSPSLGRRKFRGSFSEQERSWIVRRPFEISSVDKHVEDTFN